MPELWIDVSRWQGHIDWRAVAASNRVHGAFCKAGGGDQGIYEDPAFQANWQAIADAGLRRGAYWFFDHRQDTQLQAGKLLALTHDARPGDVRAGDFEGSQGDIRQQAVGFMQAIDRGDGPWIYGNAYGLEQLLGKDPRFGKYPLWLAGYPNYPFVPKPWSGIVAHQFTDHGSIPGVPGNVDESWFYGPGQVPAPIPAPMPPPPQEELMDTTVTIAPGKAFVLPTTFSHGRKLGMAASIASDDSADPQTEPASQKLTVVAKDGNGKVPAGYLWAFDVQDGWGFFPGATDNTEDLSALTGGRQDLALKFVNPGPLPVYLRVFEF